MEFEKFWAWVRDGGWVNLAGGAVAVIVVFSVVWLAWPQIKPKPKPQPQSLSTVVPSTESEADGAKNPDATPVPEAVVKQIAEDLGEDPAKMSIHWEQGSDNKKIVVRTQRSALQWEELTFVERGDRWVQE